MILIILIEEPEDILFGSSSKCFKKIFMIIFIALLMFITVLNRIVATVNSVFLLDFKVNGYY